MKKLTDHELDSLFKAAAEGLEPPFDASSWEAMNTKLSQPKVGAWKNWMSLTTFGILLFSLGVWFGSELNSTKDSQKNDSQEIVIASNETGKTQPLNTESIAVSPASVSENSLADRSHHSKPSKGARQEGRNNHITKGTAAGDVSYLQRNPTDQQTQTSEATTDLPSREARINGLLQENKSLVQISDAIRDSVQREAAVIIIDSTLQKDEEEVIEKPTLSRSLFLKLSTAPDFSSINFGSTSSIGSNYSLQLEYQFAHHWSISTGAIGSMKKYTASEISYGTRVADRLDGACRIIDIPVTLQYYFKTKSRSSFFVSMGFSSYVMLSEDYHYSINYSSGSRYYESSIRRENNEWFKILNASIGFQYKVKPRWHLQVEPFLKAPLTGVGEGDVLLSSMGVFIGAKFKIK